MPRRLKIVQARTMVLGERNDPLHAEIVLRGAAAEDLDAAWTALQGHVPGATFETLVRAVVKLGSRAVLRSVRAKVPMTLDGEVVPHGRGKGVAEALR